VNKKTIDLINIAFVSIETILLVLILFVLNSVSIVCFLTVCVAFCFSLLLFGEQKRGCYKSIALLFTVVSDVFLVIVYQKSGQMLHQILGVCFFTVVQALYFIYLILSTSKKSLKITHVCVRVFLSVIMPIVAYMVCKEKTNFLIVITVIYFTNLVLNCVFAFIEYCKHNIFAIGLLLFIFCDVFVGANAMQGVLFTASKGSLAYFMACPPFNFTWLFYVLSQTLIVLSFSYKLIPNKKEN
jgi:hypothetical protein